jgi:hypothetical protein
MKHLNRHDEDEIMNTKLISESLMDSGNIRRARDQLLQSERISRVFFSQIRPPGLSPSYFLFF